LHTEIYQLRVILVFERSILLKSDESAQIDLQVIFDAMKKIK